MFLCAANEYVDLIMTKFLTIEPALQYEIAEQLKAAELRKRI